MNIVQLTAKLAEPGNVCLLLLAATVGFLLIRTQRNLTRQFMNNVPEKFESYAADCRRPSSRREIGAGNSDAFDHLQIEMHEQARALSAQIDTKLALLQTLTAEAHTAAARLEAALAREEELHTPSTESSEDSVVLALRSTGLALDQIDPADFPIKSDSADASNGVAATIADQRNEIYMLADRGYNAGEIARRVGRLKGEVELVLSLRAA